MKTNVVAALTIRTGVLSRIGAVSLAAVVASSVLLSPDSSSPKDSPSASEARESSVAHAAAGSAVISGQIGGPVLAVAESRGISWVGVGPRVFAYAACSGTATELGRSAVLPGIVHDIVISGEHAYLGLGADGFGVVDISDPSNLRMIGHATVYGFVRKVIIQEPFAYLVAGYGGMPILQIDDPRSPSVVGTFAAIVSDIAIENDWAFVVSRNLKLVNIEDRTAPFERAKMAEWADSVEVRDGRLYVGESDDPTKSRRQGFLRIYDVHSPNKNRPRLTSTQIGDPVKDIQLDARDGQRAWVLTRSEIVEVGGIRPSPSPFVIRRRNMFEPARTLSLAAGELHVTLGGGGLLSVGLPGFGDKTLLAGLGSAENVVTSGRYVYVDDEGDLVRGDRIRVIDAFDPYQPREIGSISVNTEARSLAMGEGVLFVGDEDQVLHAYDVSLGFPAPELGTLALPKKIWAIDVDSSAVDGTVVYVANNDRVYAIDASNPRALTILSERTTSWGVTDVAVDGATDVAVATGPDSQRRTFRDTIHRIDIMNPELMHQRADLPTDGWRSGLEIGGGFAYAGEDTLQIYDLREPGAITETATLDIEGDINDKALAGDRLALAVEISEGGGFLRLIDVSSPGAPVAAESIDLIDWVRDVTIDEERGLVFAAAHEAGLFILGLNEPPEPPAPEPTPERTPFPDAVINYLPIVAKGGLAKACPVAP